MELHEREFPSFQDFLDREERMQYVENPRKMANYECCRAIIKTMEAEFEIKVRARSIKGGIEVIFYLESTPNYPGFNVLLAEVITRSHEFSVMVDPEDPSFVQLSLIFYTCDRILDGVLKMDC